MSAHVLLNLLNELRKRNKMRGLLSILFLYRNEINKSNNTAAQMLDSIYHMTLKLFEIIFLALTRNGFAISVTLKASFPNVSRKSVNH